MLVSEPLPPMPAELATLDGVLYQRAVAMAGSVRGLQHLLGDSYKREFLEQLLPRLCERVEEARALASAGMVKEAGTRYQGLAVASEVMALEVALVQVADYADHAGEPSVIGRSRLAAYDQDMAPLMAAALSNDREQLANALSVGSVRYREWLDILDKWQRDLKLGAERVEVAHKLWAFSLAVVAAYEMAGVAAELAVGSGLPPAMGAIAGSSGTGAMVGNQAALVEAAAALQKLIAMGAIDSVIVAGLAQMSGANAGSAPGPKPGPMAGPSASVDLGRVSGILRDAARGKGNCSVGAATRAEAETAGRAWVGHGARPSSDGKALVSEDGLRIYRPPSYKPNLGRTQANFERKLAPDAQPFSNAHLEIVEP